MAGKPKLSINKVVKTLEECNGLISFAARRLKCHPQTIYNYRDKYPAVQQAIDNARESLVDEGEGSLRRAVRNGEGWAVALLLRTLGKGRGYIETQKIEQTLTDRRGEAMAELDEKLAEIKQRMSGL